VKELLSRERVPFVVRNVDEDEAAYAELVALGYRSVPVTVLGSKSLKGFDARALVDAVADWKKSAGV
jgi:glutaredoxin